MNDKKLECLVEGYEGTYFEVGQVWETRSGTKIILKNIIDDKDYPLSFDVGYRDLEEFTLKGTFYEDIGHRFDLIKLISTEAPTETTSYDHNQKTLSEYLKENNAYESFVENSVECFLSNKDDYHKTKLENDVIYLGNTFNWRDTKQGFDYWCNLHNNQPYDLIFDMNEIIFAEVDKRITKQKVVPEFITDEEFSKMLEAKSPKKYMIFVEGKDAPEKVHTNLEKAETEAKRLATIEVGAKVSIVEVIKEFKSEVVINEVKNNLG